MTSSRDSSETDLEAPFSVVIPCYNAAATISEALFSVYAQTIAPTEIIVVDDGSTDSSAETVQSQFPEVRILRQRNSGAAAARNAGALAASCAFVAFLDADDVWLPNHLSWLSRAIQAFPDVLIVGSMASPREVRFWQDQRGRCGKRSEPIRRVDFFREARRRRVSGVINMSCVALAGEVFTHRGLRFPSAIFSEDYAFFCEVSAISDLALVSLSTARIRYRADSVTGSIKVDCDETDCDRIEKLEHAKALDRITRDRAVEPSRRKSAARYRDDLLVRHWITVAANRHQECARASLPRISYPRSPHALAFRLTAWLPQPLAALIAPLARSALRLAGLPTHSPFHVRKMISRDMV